MAVSSRDKLCCAMCPVREVRIVKRVVSIRGDMAMRPSVEIKLTSEERNELERLGLAGARSGGAFRIGRTSCCWRPKGLPMCRSGACWA